MISLLRRRKLMVPEVVQTSAMDCGPASLKCLLEGFGTSASYGRLREACQTDVDGSSIDTMEEVAVQLGLQAEQIMVPLDHLFIPGLEPLPALIVVRRDNNAAHFLVAWRRIGPLIQLMDPAVGRRWITTRNFLEEVYVHTMPVPATTWREWASTPAFCDALQKRMTNLGMTRGKARSLIGGAVAGPNWRALAALDAATRMTAAIVQSGGVKRGSQATLVVERFAARASEVAPTESLAIPAEFWSAQPLPANSDGEEQVLLRGSVLVQVRGTSASTQPELDEPNESEKRELSPELMAAVAENPSRPGLELLRTLLADGVLTPGLLFFTLIAAAAGLVVEALLFRGLFDIGRELNISSQRLGAIGALIIFVGALLLLELPIIATVLRMGRRLEMRLRMLFMHKIPRLGDRYFQSRLTSDMTERSHSLQRMRMLPGLGERFVRIGAELILTTLGIIWLDPASAPLIVITAVLAVAVPLAAQPILVERNLRMRNHGGGLSRFYLDSLMGLFAIRAHGAEQAVRREHEKLLIQWAKSGLGLQRAVVVSEALQFITGFGLSAVLLLNYFGRAGDSGAVLLFVYWVLNIPILGQELGLVARQYPDYRNVALRLLEPIGALEETVTAPDQHEATPPRTSTPQSKTEPVPDENLVPTLNAIPKVHSSRNGSRSPGSTDGRSVDFENVSVRAAGHTVLEDINLHISAGEHLAVVGSSGAGKSSLVGILLGWHRPASGKVLIDEKLLSGRRLEELRRQIAWVDPSVQLWNRSFIDNLQYGSNQVGSQSINHAIKQSDLLDVLEKLPDGLQTALGEGGALVSGGQGQRVRLGRAMLRENVKLVILDEPFRGLERERRRRLLVRARQHWDKTTLICITHDVGETLGFERVIVIHEGRVVEDGNPARLAKRSDSRYSCLLAAEEEVRRGMWARADWRRLLLKNKQVLETGEVTPVARVATCET